MVTLAILSAFFIFTAACISPSAPATLPSDNATLWEKAEWERDHGSVCQCTPAFDLAGSIILLPSTNVTISRVAYKVYLTPGTTLPDLKNTSFTLSTKNFEKTVYYDDPAINLTCVLIDGTVINNREVSFNNLPEYGDTYVELDLRKMGFISPGLGPDERFSLVMTPPSGYRFAITRSTPAEFTQGKAIEIRGWH
jgi:archaellin